ncbi:hypothetical protein [Kitasatospora sp. DSM 101779]|uniref:hypothetical protein n=1 Tax=Kitasatospora sp. DSM 101779 TaxID=2853165 RepID=UPI0021D8745F|nr:hypothetical protein [Kitasatospora sp. DSM 101779]MCU7825980.1 hypothetical protein [Kitasatospora sp. DSM 101779]
MGDRLTSLEDLKSKFAKYPELADLFKEIEAKTREINQYNKSSAGNDDLGKTYHQQVDEPTSIITELFKKVQQAVENAGQGGKNTADILNDGDDRAAHLP